MVIANSVAPLIRLVAASAAIIAVFPCGAQETFQGAPSAQTAAAMGIPGPAPEEKGIAVEGWLVYPSFFFGYIFNDNVYGRSTNRVAASGVRVRPAFEALRDNGLHRTMVYVDADVQAYPGLGVGERFGQLLQVYDAPPTNVAARAGVNHIWDPAQDVTVRFALDFVRQSGLFAPSFGANATQSFTMGSANFSAAQQYANRVSGVASVEKKINDRTFLRATAGAQYISYDSRPTFSSFPGVTAPFNGSQTISAYQNGYGYRAMLRGGFWVTPQIYGFVEPGADIRRYDNSFFDSNGYRVIAGVGSDMISLFRGEVYAGYQFQASASGVLGRSESPAFGARVFYYPTRDISVGLGVDQTLSSAAAPLNGVATLYWGWGGRPGVASVTRQAVMHGEYAVTPYLTASIRGGYGETSFDWPQMVNYAWSGGASVSYNFWRNMSLTADYQFMKTGLRGDRFTLLDATPFLQGYVKNMVSLGVTYRF